MSRPTARAVALRLLVAVDAEGAFANLTLSRLLAGSTLAARERAFATELGYGTLRTQGTLDHLLSFDLDRPLGALDVDVRAALRLGAYQLLRLRTPAHAAVGETAGLINPKARGLVNAVLRATATRCREADPLGLSALTDPMDVLALRYAHPRWIVEAFREALGGDLGETERALAADDERPRVHLAAVPGRMSADELAVESGGRRGRLSPFAVHLATGGEPGALRSVRSGSARVQDEGSQLCALALHRALPDPISRQFADIPGGPVAHGVADALLRDDIVVERTVDLCAGPGGKAVLLAALGDSRRQVVALDIRPHRAALVRSAGLRDVVVGDGRSPPFATADAVLVDAPCTGLGSLRRRPEARWRRSPEDLPDLLALQRALLDAALRLVRPGGIVAYCVCSPVLAEAVVAPRPDAEILDAPQLLCLDASARAPEAGGRRLQLWPHRHGTDAMSATLLRRTRPD